MLCSKQSLRWKIIGEVSSFITIVSLENMTEWNTQVVRFRSVNPARSLPLVIGSNDGIWEMRFVRLHPDMTIGDIMRFA